MGSSEACLTMLGKWVRYANRGAARRLRQALQVTEEGVVEEASVIADTNGPIATVVLNRPDQRNALNPAMLAELARVLESLSGDSKTRVVLLKGMGDKAFCAGYDITAIPSDISQGAGRASRIHNPVAQCMAKLAELPLPTIAMINGAAFGAGLELAVCCDIRVACRGAQMGMPPARLGLVYMPEGLQRFVSLVGIGNAKEIFLTGHPFDAEKAKELGLVQHVVEKRQLEPFTLALAEEIAANAPLALAGLKQVINRVSSRRLAADERGACEELVVRCLASDDFKEARQAFLEKRKPTFKGK